MSFKKWINKKDGATALEYALLAGGISLTIVATILIFGGQLSDIFTTATESMSEITDS